MIFKFNPQLISTIELFFMPFVWQTIRFVNLGNFFFDSLNYIMKCNVLYPVHKISRIFQ